jgi:hypothetical protein
LEREELSYLSFGFMKREWLLHVLNDMRLFGTFAFAFVAFAAGTASASPYRLPNNAAWPTEHQKALRYAETQSRPYAMNYADEAAQSLGVKDGKWEAFTPRSSDLPSVKGSLESGRPMLILQWRPGQ